MDEPARSTDELDPPSAPTPNPRLRVEIHDATARLGDADRAWLGGRADAAAGELAAKHDLGGEVRVLIVNDDRMAAAHAQYSNDPTTTDVLTFDLSEGDEVDVDIYVCLDEAARHAEKLEHETSRELLLYIVHGILHCLGHDDHDDAAYAAMHAAEDELLEAIGVGRTFDRGEPAGVEPPAESGGDA